ncbi:MAG: LLM class flavin-dependent oxidoreductase [Chromatiales bacterium]|jgi:alkanesulfonate monooxygenase SsuD/methylene tetrahydromethanopterin reductase-like flavin-dependent oxidoreductase (luciferase family)|nr:LLM class flavin-dependent oxidoreductase [Chromatiales bacterium]
MKFGTFHLMEQPFTKSEAQVYREQLSQIRLADDIGFDSVWLTEHHFSSLPHVPDVPGEYCVSASPYALACAVSQITKRVRIGSAVKVLPLEHPLRTAEDVAMADILSEGRIEFGVGTGYRKYEFEGLTVPLEEKAERFDEALNIILGAWTTDEFSYQGKFYDVPTLTLVPRPVQKPHPPVWIATRLGTQDVIDYTAARGFKLLCAWAPRDELRATYHQLLEAQAKLEIADPLVFTCLRHVYVGESDAAAQRDGNKYVDYYMNSTALFRPVGAHERGEMIFGGPQTCMEKLATLRDESGINNLICWMNFGGLPQTMVEDSMHRFAQEVMPAFQS